MLASLRRNIVDTWVGRVIAILFVIAFAGWGIGDMLTNIFNPAAGGVAKVGGQSVSAQEFDQAYQTALRQVAQQQHTDPSTFDVQTRRAIATQTIEQLASQTELVKQAQKQGIRVTDSVLRDAVFAIPGFHNAKGEFDHTILDQRLAQAGLTEPALLSMMRADLTTQGLMGALQAGVVAPTPLVDSAFAYSTATRTADYVTIPFADPASIPAPDDATLRRFYDNHPKLFQSPEYRHIKAVVLTADTVAHDTKVPDADIRRAYDMLTTRYILPERRSVDILIGSDRARLAALAASWSHGASFDDIKKQAGNDVTPVSLTEAPQTEFPSPDLGKAVFAAAAQAVTGPVQTDGGWAVFRVGTVIAPHTTTFDQAKPDLALEIAKARAGSELSARATKLQDAIAGGGLDSIPTDIGAAPLLGSLDAQGQTPEGEPAPLPGPDSLRKAIIAKAFELKPNTPPRVEQVGSDGYYALTVDSVTPAAPRSFEQVHDAVLTAWRAAEARRQANEKAAALYAKAQGANAPRADGQHAGVMQAVAGTLPVTQSPQIPRDKTPEGVPPELARVAFDVPVGQSTMLEDGNAFIVATITGAQTHAPSSDQLAYRQSREALNHAMGEDVGLSYLAWLRAHDTVAINSKMIDSMVTQP